MTHPTSRLATRPANTATAAGRTALLRRLLVCGCLLLVAALSAACVRMPEKGPVVEDDRAADGDSLAAPRIDPEPPAPGARPTEVVQGFLDAMTADPLQTSVARQFLTDQAADQWNPQASTITYGYTSPADGVSNVSVRLGSAHRLDGMGAWQGALPAKQSRLTFQMTVENAEWRIVKAPDALIVPQEWFDLRYRQVSLYYFDPEARMLVPEPVFVPVGDQLATTMTRALFKGSRPGLAGVVRSFVPQVLPGPTVTVADNGTADINLGGAQDQVQPGTMGLMLVQLAWTLRQDPSIKEFRLISGGQPLQLPNGETSYPVNGGGEYSPVGSLSTESLYGVRAGRMVRVTDGTEVATSGPLGQGIAQLDQVGVSLDERRAAGVVQGGHQVILAPVSGEGTPNVVMDSADDLLRPTWDGQGRLWLLDRTPRGAEVSYVQDGRRRAIQVPGVSGQRVSSFAVSRDGTRLIAAVRGSGGDTVKVRRVAQDTRGLVDRMVPGRDIVPASSGLRVLSMGWRSATQLVVLNRTTESTVDLRAVALDGSPGGVADQPITGSTRSVATGLVTSPATGSPMYAVSQQGVLIVLEPADQRGSTLRSRARNLTYPG